MTRTIVRERIPPTDPRLGRRVNHDTESWRYAWRTPHPGRRLTSVRHTRRVPVLDQGQLGSCTGNAGIGCLGTDPYYATISPTDHWHALNEADAVALYSSATGADDYPGQYPPDDTGSDGLTIAKVLTEAGEIAGYQWAFTVADALAALQTRPLISGVPWYDDMFNPDPATGIASIGGTLAGGHEFVVDEYDADRQLVGCTNSWGTGWGMSGRFYLRVTDWATLLAEQGDVTIFVPSTDPPPIPTPDPDRVADRTFADVLHLWVARRHVGDNERTARAARTWLTKRGL